MSKKSRAQRARERPCPALWGSHGCKKQAGHLGMHYCNCGGPGVSSELPLTDHGFVIDPPPKEPE